MHVRSVWSVKLKKVIEGNERAKHMYETFGFAEVGRIPKANKYDDGTYADDILMYKDLRT